MQRIYLILLAFLQLCMNSQTKFQRVYAANYQTVFNDGVSTSDSGYIICGSSVSGNELVVKTNKYGIIQWSGEYGDFLNPFVANHIIGLKKSGYVIVGGTSIPYQGSDRINITRLDNAGNILWNRIFKDTGNAFKDPSVRQVKDGGLILSVGDITGKTSYYSIVKVDPNGQVLWSKRFSEVGNKFKTSYCDISESYSEKAYTMCGGGDYGETILVSYDTVGNYLWSKRYSQLVNKAFSFDNIIYSKDGGYVISGSNYYYDPMLIKMDSVGNIQWARKYVNLSYSPYQKGAYSGRVTVKPATDGGYYLTGLSYRYPLLIKVRSNGFVEWARVYTNKKSNCYGDVFSAGLCPDKGFALGTTVSDTLCSYYFGSIIKTDSVGNSGCNDLTVTYTDSSLVFNVAVDIFTSNELLGDIVNWNSVRVQTDYSDNCSNTIPEYIIEKGRDADIRTFPNPTSGSMNITAKDMSILKAEISDCRGELLRESDHVDGTDHFVIDLGAENPGVYILRLYTSQGLRIVKLIKI